MRLYVAIALSALLSTSTAQAGHHEMGEAIGSAVIGTVFSKEQQAKGYGCWRLKSPANMGRLH